jgi:gas vesicle protein
MAERLHESSDIANADIYPAEAAGVSSSNGDAGLERRARQIGNALGRAVVTLRQAQDTIKDIASETSELAVIRVGEAKSKTQETATRISNTVKNKTQEWSAAAASRAAHLQQTALGKAADVRAELRSRANQAIRDYPLHLVLAAGAAGFLLGVGLGIWRSNLEH